MGAATTKRCFKCGDTKPLGDFYKHRQTSDGHLNKCKECQKKDVRARYYLVHDDRAAYERARKSRPRRREQARRSQRQGRLNNPDKRRARDAVSNAIRDGRLKREPCRRCGTTKRVQAHHEDYAKPLEVEWLCFRCHRELGHGQTVATQDGDQPT